MPADPRTPSAVRFSPEERALVRRAAQEEAAPFTTFVRMAAVAAAKRILADMAKREKGKGK